MGKAFNPTQRAKIARGECVELDCTSRDVPVELSGGRKQVRCRSCQAKRRAIQQGDTSEKACGCGKPAVPLSNQCTKCMLNDDAPEAGGTKTRDDLKALQRYLQKIASCPNGAQVLRRASEIVRAHCLALVGTGTGQLFEEYRATIEAVAIAQREILLPAPKKVAPAPPVWETRRYEQYLSPRDL